MLCLLMQQLFQVLSLSFYSPHLIVEENLWYFFNESFISNIYFTRTRTVLLSDSYIDLLTEINRVTKENIGVLCLNPGYVHA